jgi:hypothetical protein
MGTAGESYGGDETLARLLRDQEADKDTKRTALVVEPYLSAEARRHLVQKIRRSKSDLELGVGCTGIAFSIIGAITLIILHFAIGLSWWWMFASALPLIIGFTGAFALSTELDGSDHKHFVESSDLDAPCRKLLLRAQDAIGIVLKSQVYTEKQLEPAVEEMALRRHEWEVATMLRDISSLRKEHEASRDEKSQGPRTKAVLDSQRQALELATNATVSRIKALERYATQLRAADDALRDWHNAQRASGLNDRYLDLIARTAADEHAIKEIQGLTDQAAAAAEAFRDSLDQASMAAEALVLPPLAK